MTGQSDKFSAAPGPPVTRDPLIYDADRDDVGRLAQWRAVLSDSRDFPPVLRATILLDAWNRLEVVEHAPWLGRLLAASSLLREAGLTMVAHLAAFNRRLKSITRERRTHRIARRGFWRSSMGSAPTLTSD